MWALLIKRYWQVSIFRESPANSPYSPLLLFLIALIYYLILIIQWKITDLSAQLPMFGVWLLALTVLGSYAVYTIGLLTLCKKGGRVVQTLSCLYAGHGFIHVFAFPLLIGAPLLKQADVVNTAGFLLGILYLIFTLILTVWQFMISAYLYKEALKIEYIPAVLASIGLMAMNILTVSIWR